MFEQYSHSITTVISQEGRGTGLGDTLLHEYKGGFPQLKIQDGKENAS